MNHGYNVRKETKTIPNPPSDYMKKFYYDIIAHSSESLSYLIKLVGADKVLIGTDYPFDMGLLDPLSVLADISLKEEERDLIYGGNVNRIMRV
jgi:aminocarboxymuconate-semialdehyde decarboxylase